MKFIRSFIRILSGMVFIFSGFVKGIDLTGSAIKFGDYFQAFHLDFLQPLSFPLAFLFPAAEFMIGVSLLFSLRVRTGIRGFFFFMLFFTPLTLILALFNPVRDCGCFGDALVMTNWETFGKNGVLLLFALILFFQKDISPSSRTGKEWFLLSVYFVLFTAVSWYSYNHLPLLDFRPYRTGTHIPSKMTLPDDAPHDVYKTVLIYEKNGVRKTFSMDNIPWQDTAWRFVDQKTTLVKKGYTPPIHDFSFTLPDGTDITDYILGSKGYIFLLISYDFSKANIRALKDAVNLYVWSQDHGIPFYVVTASPEESATKYFSKSYPIPWTNMDETTCKTMIRSNPGLLLLKEGTILAKWHYHDFPIPGDLEEDLLSQSIISLRRRGDIRLILLLTAILLLPATLWKNRRKER